MKRYLRNLLFFGLSFIFIIACEKEDDSARYQDFSDAVVAFGNSKIERGDFTSFADLSKGVISRTWTIPQSATIINSDGQNPSDMDLIDVRFDEAGQFEVNLSSEFINPEVQLDTTFNVTVLDYIQANFEVVSIDAGSHEQTPTQIIMYQGGTITFQDVSQGSPNRRKWSFPGGDPSSAGGINFEEDEDVRTISVNYPTIGNFDVELISWRQYPQGIADTLRLQNYVNVTENLDPPSVVSIIEDIGGIIHLTYNLPLQSESENLSSNFTLNVDGFVVQIQDVFIDPEDNRIIKIIPNINPNVLANVTLSYDGEADISRLNDVPVEAFNQEQVMLYSIADPNIYGFEDGGEGWDVPWEWDNVGEITYPAENSASGQYSMKMQAFVDDRCRAYSRKDGSIFYLDSNKDYTIEFKVWIDESYTDSNIFPEVIFYDNWTPEGFWTSTDDIPRGQWITINKEATKIWSPNNSGEYFFSFRFQKIGIIYIDDIKIYEVE